MNELFSGFDEFEFFFKLSLFFMALAISVAVVFSFDRIASAAESFFRDTIYPILTLEVAKVDFGQVFLFLVFLSLLSLALAFLAAILKPYLRSKKEEDRGIKPEVEK